MDTQSLATFFKALSEPVRLRVLYLLIKNEELCVCDIEESLNLSQSVISRHLAYLRNTGLVTSRRDGVWIYYQLKKIDRRFLDFLLLHGKDNKDIKDDLQRFYATDRKCK